MSGAICTAGAAGSLVTAWARQNGLLPPAMQEVFHAGFTIAILDICNGGRTFTSFHCPQVDNPLAAPTVAAPPISLLSPTLVLLLGATDQFFIPLMRPPTWATQADSKGRLLKLEGTTVAQTRGSPTPVTGALGPGDNVTGAT